MNTETQVLRLIIPSGKELTKSGIKSLADNVVINVLEEGNYFQVAEALKGMEELVKEVRKSPAYINGIREELEKHKGILYTDSGAKIEAAETGVSYDYSANPKWVEIDEQIKQLTEQKKKLEESLKRIAPGKLLVDEDTGETLVGPSKISTSNYKIELKK